MATVKQHQTPQSPRPRNPGDSHPVLGFLSVAAALWAVYEVLGIGNVFGYVGLSNDDAAAKAQEDVAQAFFDPVGFVVLLGLLGATIVFYWITKTGVTKGSLIATAILFVLSFFRVSMIFPLIFSGMGTAVATVSNESDSRAPRAEEYVLDTAQLVRYEGDEGVRVTTALTNTTDEHWESATVVLTYSDAAGAVCGTYERNEDFLAPQERVEVTTEFLAAATRFVDPSCVPATAEAELTSIDMDSRAEIPESDYEGRRPTAPELTSLSVAETAGIVDSVVMLSVTGAVVPGVEGPLPMAFELVDHDGLRLAWCFKPEDVQPDGSFVTKQYHSPVEPGLYTSVAVVPSC